MILDVPEPTKWLGETVGFWVQTAVLAVSAIAAIWIILANTKQEKRRATIDLVLEQKRDATLKAARSALTKMHEAGEKNLSKYLDDPECDQYKAILLVLNTHEFVASGIREGAFDEATYKRIRFSTLRKDWDALCAFVLEFRRVRGSRTLFQDFQWLNGRWEKKPLKADNGNPTSLN